MDRELRGSFAYDDKQETVDQLFERIKYCNDRYRVGEPIISDAEYDTLIKELEELQPDHEWLYEIEPVNVPQNRKIKLPIPMKSLDKKKTIAEVKSWFNKLGIDKNTRLLLMPKFDGISLLVQEFSSKAYTRGGEENEGMDCGLHLIQMGHQKNDKYLFTSGEAIISKQNWRDHFQGKNNPITGEPYKSARNVVSGLFRRDIPLRELEHVDYVRYNSFGSDGFVLFQDLLDNFSNSFGQKKYYALCDQENLTHEFMQKLFDEWSEDYWIDGIVVYINDLRLWDQIGRSESTLNPQWAIAYKGDFEEVFETKVIDVNCRVSKNGYLRPTVEIEPVFIGGAKVDNPTGNNAKFIFDNNIAAGSVVKVKRSGEVIPKIIGVISHDEQEVNKLADRMTECPACGSVTKWNESFTDIVCTNQDCTGRKLAKIIHFFMTVGYDGIGEEILEKLFNAGYDSISKILNLKYDEVARVSGLGNSVADLIVNQHNDRIIKTRFELPVLIHASDCFLGIGQSKSKKMLEQLSDHGVEMLLSGTLNYDNCDIHDNKFLESKTCFDFMAGVTSFSRFMIENKLSWSGTHENEVLGDKCEEMNVCFTGVRDKNLEGIIKSNGGSVASGVSKNTTHVVAKDIDGNSSKLIDARGRGIPIMTIEHFKILLKNMF